MNSTSSVSAQLFFTTNTSQGFTESKSKVFPIVANSGFVEYTIDMSAVPEWTGTLLQLRFDPGYSTGLFILDYVRLGRVVVPPTPTPSPTVTKTPTASPTPSVTPTPQPVLYNGVWTKYYFAGTSRIAMRTCTGTTCGEPTYLLTDHLGSTSITTNAAGTVTSALRYSPWGEVRHTWGIPPTDYTFTAQYSNVEDFGLMFYQSRYYDPALGRFASADTIVPGGAQGLDRFAYVNNNPVRYTDPSGHKACLDTDKDGKCVHQAKGSIYDDLTKKGETAYQYYLHLKDKYPDLTLTQFFGLMTMYEINGNPEAQESIIKSAVDQLFSPNHGRGIKNPYCPGNGDCVAEIFNYLGAYSESAYKHATSYNDAPPPLLASTSGDFLTDAQFIGSEIMKQKRIHQPFRGIHYGNGPDWLEAARNRLSFGDGIRQVLTMDGSFVAFTVNQENFWMCVAGNGYATCSVAYGLNPKTQP